MLDFYWLHVGTKSTKTALHSVALMVFMGIRPEAYTDIVERTLFSKPHLSQSQHITCYRQNLARIPTFSTVEYFLP